MTRVGSQRHSKKIINIIIVVVGLVDTSKTTFCDERLTSQPAVCRYLKDVMLIANICAVY